MTRSTRVKREILSYLAITLGTIIFVIGTKGMIIASELAMAGVNGLAIVIHYLTYLPVGAVAFAINVPLIILSWKYINREFGFKTVFAVVLSSFLIDQIGDFSLVPADDKFLGALYGGIVYGSGVGIVFRYGGSVGGVGVLAKFFNKSFGISIGTVNFLLNTLIILVIAATIGSQTALYTILAIFAAGRMMDLVQSGLPTKTVFIVSNQEAGLISAIQGELGRGVTILKGEEAHSGEEKKILLCAIYWEDLYRLKNLVKGIDPEAFLIIGNAKEIIGKGFKAI
ncbi:MAG: hypothetical protein DDT21_00502 [Syntrophomonadaceae bacterium]|nr:hypothetical protein [Bacillota bacterium]